jgi:hypothetical protein
MVAWLWLSLKKKVCLHCYYNVVVVVVSLMVDGCMVVVFIYKDLLTLLTIVVAVVVQLMVAWLWLLFKHICLH